jgi:hypothetical protein
MKLINITVKTSLSGIFFIFSSSDISIDRKKRKKDSPSTSFVMTLSYPVFLFLCFFFTIFFVRFLLSFHSI